MRRQENILRNPSYGGRPRLYRFDASLRIVGVGAHHDAISLRTGLLPARSIRKGERRVGQRLWTQDVWLLDSPLGGMLPWMGTLNGFGTPSLRTEITFERSFPSHQVLTSCLGAFPKVHILT